MKDDIESLTRKTFVKVTIETCQQRYPKEIQVIDQFVERGATEEVIRRALLNKFGLTPKSMWLANYAVIRLDQRDFAEIFQRGVK